MALNLELDSRLTRQSGPLASNGSVDNRSLSARKGSLAACSDYASVKAVFVAMSDPAGRRWYFLRLSGCTQSPSATCRIPYYP